MTANNAIVAKLRQTAQTVEDMPVPAIKELLREAAEHIEALSRQLQDGETFLNFSSRSPRKDPDPEPAN